MREQTSLIKEFNHDDEVVTNDAATAINTFNVPNRNWGAVIDNYNATHKRKFPLSAVQCKVIIEFVKKGTPPKFIFKTVGITPQRYGNLVNKAGELNERLEILATKELLNDGEYEEMQDIMRNPLRILMDDIARAEGISDLVDWERFNEQSERFPEIQLVKMKAKFKEIFGEKNTENGGLNVQINLGGDFIKDM